jgi:hypothetical protein
MNRQTLEANKIFYHEDAIPKDAPPHFHGLRRILLDFRDTVQDRLSLEIDSDTSHYEHTLDGHSASNEGLEDTRKYLRLCLERANKGSSCDKSEERETEWGNFFKTEILKPLEDRAKACNSDSRQ